MLPWFHRTRRAYRIGTWMTRSGTFISYRSVSGGQAEPVTGKGTTGRQERDGSEGRSGRRLRGDSLTQTLGGDGGRGSPDSRERGGDTRSP